MCIYGLVNKGLDDEGHDEGRGNEQDEEKKIESVNEPISAPPGKKSFF